MNISKKNKALQIVLNEYKAKRKIFAALSSLTHKENKRVNAIDKRASINNVVFIVDKFNLWLITFFHKGMSYFITQSTIFYININLTSR